MQNFLFKICFLFTFFWGNATTAWTQELTAYTTEKEVTVSQPFEVVFSLKNVRGSNFTPPNFKDIRVVSGPSQSSSTTIINGAASSEMSITYVLIAEKEGILKIPPASIVANGKTLRSNALTVKVKKAKKLDFDSKDGVPNVFVRLEPSTDQAVTGQQILLDYRLYTSVDLQDINITAESEYAGFFFEPLRRFSRSQTRQNINGKEFTTQIIRRIALFPQQAGDFEIESSQISAQVVTGTRRSGFFTYRDTKPVYLQTDPLTIQVRSLPAANVPATFTGAVGDDFEVLVNIPRNTLTTDDAIALRMTIRGNGDIKRVQPPALDFGDKFEVYEPKVLQEENYENRGELYGKKIVEYLVLPRQAGEYRLQADFSYYNPDSTSFQTASATTPLLTIKQGVKSTEQDISVNRSEDIKKNTLLPNKTTASFSQKGNPFFGSTPFWILMGLPFLGLLAAIIYKKKQAEKGDIDPQAMKMRQAVRLAREKLAIARQHMETGQSRSFYDEVQRAFLGYVSDKLQIPPAEMSKSNVKQKLETLQVSSDNIEAFLKILSTCEMALFAGMDNSSAMSETYENAEAVIVNIEEELNK